MDVILDLVGKVKVDDHVHLLDVETSRGDVGGDEDGDATGSKLVEDPVSLALLLVAVDHRAHAAHASPNLVAHLLGAAEHDRLERLRGRVAKHLHQALLLLEPAAHLHDLRDVLVGDEGVGVADVDLDGVGEDGGRDAHHRPWPRRGEKQRLSLRGRPLQDLSNLRLEAHVQHPVRLVEHHVRGRAEVDGAGLEKVVEPSRGRDGDLRSVAEFPELVPLGRAAVQAHGIHADGSAELCRLVLDLRGELARRGEDGDGGPDGPRERGPLPAADVHDPREEVSHRLARSRLCDGDEVVSLQRDWPRLRLDGGRGLVPGPVDGVHELSRPFPVGEALHGVRNDDAVRRLDGDLVAPTVLGSVFGGLVVEIGDAEAAAALVRVGRRRVVLLLAAGLVVSQRAALGGAAEVRVIDRGLGRLTCDGTFVLRHVRLGVPVVRESLGVNLLPRRGEPRAAHGALHHARVDSRVLGVRCVVAGGRARKWRSDLGKISPTIPRSAGNEGTGGAPPPLVRLKTGPRECMRVR